MFGNLGAGEIVLIVLAIIILFGAKKIPELAQGIGKGMKEFKKALRDVEEDIKISDKDDSSEKDKKS
ncbi:MAG: twin-arginine translocase TatA/TatE family subunit [Melioribacteraceae bacterium]|nr:twin-arginine translocase TatA/TatE family subunit [Melioribacteraceae bacterium]